MSRDSFHNGLANIEAALREALDEHAIVGATIKCSRDGGDAGSAEFSISANGMLQAQIFARQEIEDSAQAIDAPAAHKVRMLISHFVR